MDEESENQTKLPVHEFSPSGNHRLHSLRVDGLVRNLLVLTLTDLERLPHQTVTDDFTCLEGWTVPKVRWRGVLLKTVLSLAEPLVEARYVQASAQSFTFPLSLDRTEAALLAVGLNDTSIPPKHGGPVRLIVPGGECFTSIKWLDHLKLSAEPGTNSAERIALGRLPVPSPRSRNSEKKSNSGGHD